MRNILHRLTHIMVQTVYVRVRKPEPVNGLRLPRVKQRLYVCPQCGEQEWRDQEILVEEKWGEV